MHGHDNLIEIAMPGWWSVIPLLLIFALGAFLVGALPIPVGYERGKVKWVMWCGTGMHAHIVYWQSSEEGRSDRRQFQTMHPADYTDE